MAFDPDAYLAETTSPAPSGFDPDAYLKEAEEPKGFDPDAFLASPPSDLDTLRRRYPQPNVEIKDGQLLLGGTVPVAGSAGQPPSPEAFETAERKWYAQQWKQDQARAQKPRTFGEVVSEASFNPIDALPVIGGLKEADELAKIREAALRVSSGEASSDDRKLLADWQREQQRERTFGGKVAEILGDMPQFMADLAFTGPTYGAAREGTESAVKRALTKEAQDRIEKSLLPRLARKSSTAIVGATAQMPAAMGVRTAGSFAREDSPEMYLAEDGELILEDREGEGNSWNAAARAFGDNWVELLSERSGGLINELGGAARNALLKRGIFEALLKRNPDKPVSALTRALKEAGWNGVIGEMAEERIGDVGRHLLGLEEFSLPTAEDLLVELVAFSVPGSVSVASNYAAGRQQDRRRRERETDRAVGEDIQQRQDAPPRSVAEPQNFNEREAELAEAYNSLQESEARLAREPENELLERIIGDTRRSIRTLESDRTVRPAVAQELAAFRRERAETTPPTEKRTPPPTDEQIAEAASRDLTPTGTARLAQLLQRRRLDEAAAQDPKVNARLESIRERQRALGPLRTKPLVKWTEQELDRGTALNYGPAVREIVRRQNKARAQQNTDQTMERMRLEQMEGVPLNELKMEDLEYLADRGREDAIDEIVRREDQRAGREMQDPEEEFDRWIKSIGGIPHPENERNNGPSQGNFVGELRQIFESTQIVTKTRDGKTRRRQPNKLWGKPKGPYYSLDRMAQSAREAGFSWIQTPADLIDTLERRYVQKKEVYPDYAGADNMTAGMAKAIEDGEMNWGRKGIGEWGASRRPTNRGMTQEAVEAAIAPIRRQWRNGPRVRVVQNVDALPDRYAAALRESGTESEFEGFIDYATGDVYLIADNLESAQRAQQVLLHETIGHYGMSQFLGPDAESFLQSVAARYENRPLGRELTQTYGLDLSKPQDRLTLGDEIVARIAEGGVEDVPLWRRVVERLRQWLREAGFNLDAITEDTIRIALANARRQIEGNRREEAGNLRPVAAARRRQENLSQQDRAYLAAVERSDIETAQRMVDEAAKAAGYGIGPVYHGTLFEFNAFDNAKTGRNDRGLWGRGHYFANSLERANSYATRQGDGARVVSAFISLRNPLVLKTGDDLVIRLPDGTNTRDLVGPNLDGSKIKTIALEGGHDGVLQLKTNGEIGDLVVYSSNQIKSADPVTYDDAGNVIPLSERFNPNNPDIRFSRRAPPGRQENLFDDAEMPFNLAGESRTDPARATQREIDRRESETETAQAALEMPETAREVAAPSPALEPAPRRESTPAVLTPGQQDALRTDLRDLQGRIDGLSKQIRTHEKRGETPPPDLLGRRNVLRTEFATLLRRVEGTVPALREGKVVAWNPGGQPRPAQEQLAFSRKPTAREHNMQGSTLAEEGSVKTFTDWFSRTIRGFSAAVPELPVTGQKSRDFAMFRQGHEKMDSANDAVRKRAQEDIAHVLQPIQELGRKEVDENAVQRYREAVRLRKARQEQLQEAVQRGDSAKAIARHRKRLDALNARVEEGYAAIENNPWFLTQQAVLYRDLWFRTLITNPEGGPITLPQGLTPASIRRRLESIHGQIAENPHRERIEESLRRHYTLMEQLQTELLARGHIIPEEMRNPLYFPHHILDRFTGHLDRIKPVTEEDFRNYLISPVGSKKDIETNYLAAIYVHTANVRLHNAHQDIIERYWKPYDIGTKHQQDLEAQAMLTGETVGPDAWQNPARIPEGYRFYNVTDQLPLRPEYVIPREQIAQILGQVHEALGNPKTAAEVIQDGDLRKRLSEAGMSLEVKPNQLVQQLMVGKKEQWLVPDEIANALEGIKQREAERLGRTWNPAAMAQTLWKRNILFAPWNYPRYEFNNTLADIEKLFSADPEAFRTLPKVAREVHQFIKTGEGSADIKQAFKRGVIDSVSAAEVGALKTFEDFSAFLTTGELNRNRLRKFVQMTMPVARRREALFRYAKFKTDLDRIRRGESPRYAGAYWRDVEALPDAYEKAEYISKKTFGYYPGISVSGNFLRRNLIPFYSWVEINFRYHTNLFRNLADMTRLGEWTQAGQSASALGRSGARLPLTLTRMAAMGLTSRLALPIVAVYLWNNAFGPSVIRALGGDWDDEDDLESTLSAYDRQRQHIILGRDENGKTKVVYLPTAFSDVIEWFAGDNLMRLLGEYTRGEIEMEQVLGDWLKEVPRDIGNKAIQGVGPQIKTPIMALTQKNPFPDVFDQRTISKHDMQWAILGGMTDRTITHWTRKLLDEEYYSPQGDYEWLTQTILQVRRRDPESWAYYSIRDKAADWKEERTGVSRGGFDYNSPDLQAIRSFRKSVYNADIPNAMRFYNILLNYGYTAERFQSSIRAQDPLSGLRKDERLAFIGELSETDQRQLRSAMRYYARMRSAKGREDELFPSESKPWRWQGPQFGSLFEIMSEQQLLSDAELDARAEDLILESAAPRR